MTTSTSNVTYLYNVSTDVNIKSCPPGEWSKEKYSIWTTELGVLGCVFFIAMIGNLCVLIPLMRRKKRKTRMQLFIIYLSFADILVTLFQVLPEWLIRAGCGFRADNAACKFVKYFQIVSMYTSTYILLCAAFDRYDAIKHPLRSFQSSKRVLHMRILMACGLSLLLAIPQIFIFELPEHSRKCGKLPSVTLHFMRAYVSWYFLAIMLVPSLLLFYFYGMIAMIIIQNIKQKNNVSSTAVHGREVPRASSTAVISRAKIKTVKMTLVIVVTYIICWMPFFVVQLLGVWNIINRNAFFSSILHLLASLNSCTNPWIYLAFSGNSTTQFCQKHLCFTPSQSSPTDHDQESRVTKTITLSRYSFRQCGSEYYSVFSQIPTECDVSSNFCEVRESTNSNELSRRTQTTYLCDATIEGQ